MKFAVAAASVLASVYSQTTQAPTTPKLDAKCLDDANGVERLLIEIPYPEAKNANILYLEAGNCTQSDYILNGGAIDKSTHPDEVKIWIPIDKCDMRGIVYKTPKVSMTKSYGLINPSATVTFGQNIGGMDIIFRRLPIAAECGTRTSYTVKFDYNNVTQVDADGCTMVGDTCVFPAYGQEAKFDIKEYTNADFNVEVDSSNRANVAGSEIFLSMQVTNMPDDLKFAVTECKVTDGANSLILLNPGAEASAVPPPSCKITEIGLSGYYEGLNFNFQHILFLLNATLDSNTFTLECAVEVCNRNEASSICNQAAAVCIKDSTDVVAEQEKFTKDYMCDGLCGAGNEEQCSFEADVASCKVCMCDNGIAALGDSCSSHGSPGCASCKTDYYFEDPFCRQYTCLCSNGIPAGLSECPSENKALCASCDDGFYLENEQCKENACHCNHGTPQSGVSCSVHNSHGCENCDNDWYLDGSSCTQYTCLCDNGEAAGFDQCPSENQAFCVGCDDGFQLDGESCIVKIVQAVSFTNPRFSIINSPKYLPIYAIDGKKSNDANGEEFAHPGDSGPGGEDIQHFIVDVQNSPVIQSIKFYQRVNCCWDRFEGSRVFLNGETIECLAEKKYTAYPEMENMGRAVKPLIFNCDTDVVATDITLKVLDDGIGILEIEATGQCQGTC